MRLPMLLLIVLFPALASAQSLPAGVPPAEDPNQIVWQSPAPPPPVFNAPAAATAQILGGLGMSAIGASAGFVGGYLVVEPALGWPNGAPLPGAGTAVTMWATSAVVTSLSVWLVGKAFGGRSPFGATFAGTLVGSLGWLAHPLAGVALTPVGATAGYHMARKD